MKTLDEGCGSSKGKKKFDKVMHKFGQGKLHPGKGKKGKKRAALKSKKQGGSKAEHDQALAIAFSEAGMSESYVNRAKTVNEEWDYLGRWVHGKAKNPFDKAHDYTIKQTLIKELEQLLNKYSGQIEDKDILDALNKVGKKYNL